MTGHRYFTLHKSSYHDYSNISTLKHYNAIINITENQHNSFAFQLRLQFLSYIFIYRICNVYKVQYNLYFLSCIGMFKFTAVRFSTLQTTIITQRRQFRDATPLCTISISIYFLSKMAPMQANSAFNLHKTKPPQQVFRGL